MKNMIKKTAMIAILCVVSILWWAIAQEPVTIEIIGSPSCPHCTNAKAFLENIPKTHNIDIDILEYNLSQNTYLTVQLYEKFDVPSHMQGLIPAIFIEDKYFVGFNQQIGEEILTYILDIYNGEIKESTENPWPEREERIVNIPIIGEIDMMTYSFPALAILLWIIDGFNVCSLWALILILWLVIVLKSRKKIFAIGWAFLLTTAIVYGALVFLRHQIFSFVAPYIKSMEIFVGILAIAWWIYLLREFYKAYKQWPICSSNNMLSRLAPKVQKVFEKKGNIALIIGTVMLFAIAVTVIEFPCSAFLPVLFTSMLVEAGISTQQSIWYIWLYILFYLLDEVIIFLIAVWTLRINIVSPKFITFFNLVAAAIFLFLWFYYLLG